MINYSKVTDERDIVTIIRENEDGTISCIPIDPANSDYQAYLATLASESANDSKGNK